MHGRTPVGVETFDSITLSGFGNLELTPTTELTYTTLTWDDNGTITDNGGLFQLISGTQDVTIPGTAYLFANTPRTFNSLNVEGTISCSNNSTSKVYEVNLTVLNDAIVSGGIDVNERGLQSSAGTGEGTDGTTFSGGGGAGYGGDGGDGNGGLSGGIAYGSETNPGDLGSGGGGFTTAGTKGGRGGGVITLHVVGDLSITGDLTAHGGDGGIYTPPVPVNRYAAGGGSGGSIYLAVGGTL